MLHQRYDLENIAQFLFPTGDWQPFPDIENRAAWEGLSDAVKKAHITQAEAFLGKNYPALPATLFLEFARNGNRHNYQRVYFKRRGMLEALVVAECIENNGRFLDNIVNGIWSIAEESYWGIPAHVHIQRAGKGLPDITEPTVDLFAAETGNLMAWTFYLLEKELNAVSPLLCERIKNEIERRILTPLYERVDFHWMGLQPEEATGERRRVGNWNPWICSNWLAMNLIIERDEERRQHVVHKIMRVVDNFIDTYPEDGGCDEGPGYWGRAGASLYDTLELLYSATNGAVEIYKEPKIRDIGRFIYRVHIDDDYYINFADAPALVRPDGPLVYGFGRRIEDEDMIAHGLWLCERQGLKKNGYNCLRGGGAVNLQRLLRGLFTLKDLPEAESVAPQLRNVWLPRIEVVAMREVGGTADGFFLAAKGGHNRECHNHNDVGSFIVYIDGKPVFIDVGVETYTAKTFSNERYSIWTMQSDWHNLLPTIDGVAQLNGREFAARDVECSFTDKMDRLSLDIATAYPAEAKIDSWKRILTLKREKEITIRDQYSLKEPAGEIVMSLFTPCNVELHKPGTLNLKQRSLVDERNSGKGKFLYDASVFQADIETIKIVDERLRSVWGEKLIRIILTARKPAQKDFWTFRIKR